MNYTDYYTRLIKKLYVTREAASLPVIERVCSFLPRVPVAEVGNKEDIPEQDRNAGTLFFTHPRGDIVGRCPGTRGHICCNYLTVNLYSGCTLGCSYCIMKWYLNFEPITIVADPSSAVEKIRRIAAENRDRMVRVGTGEVGDSLQFDPLCDLSRGFIEGLADLDNVWFELKTKTDFIEHLLDIPSRGNCVIAFSLNPEEFAAAEEPEAVSIARRFAAAEKVVEAGYNIAFHFDPIIRLPDWEDNYYPLADRISGFPSDRIAWISMGTFRYPKELRHALEDRPYMFGEFVKCRDGKFRYLQNRRTELYSRLRKRLQEKGVEAPLYLCMESVTVWQQVFGGPPLKIPRTGQLFRRPSLPA